MKTGLALFGLLCLLHAATCQEEKRMPCQLPDVRGEEVDFPDIEKLGIESYMMTVEFTVPGATQTDYYVEYYDSALRMGRVESHQAGQNLLYIYRANTWEAWNIKGRKCELINITLTPEFFKNDQSDWRYDPADPSKRVRGPSAMFKMGYDKWQNNMKDRTMAYLGELPHDHIRGLKAQAWRWCQSENTSVDFFFTADETDTGYNLKKIPLRVVFSNVMEQTKMSEQKYDVISFQPFINVGQHPFELPQGIGCGRGYLDDAPDVPDITGNSMLFQSEVVYRKVKAKTQEDISSYYSNLFFALDKSSNFVAYYYSPWNTTKVNDTLVTFMDAPEYVIYDFNLGYFYKTSYASGSCEIGRTLSFVPSYRLPENAGYLDLTDSYVFFPNNEFSYLTKSRDRGLEVDVFEAVIENYVMNKDTKVKKVVATHSYLRGDEKTDNVVGVKRSPRQVELRLLREEDPEVEEILTFNFFGFTTKLMWQRRLFDVRRCFKNDDDYSWVTIAFETAEGSTSGVSGLDPTKLEFAVSQWLNEELDINPMRIPQMLVDIQDEVYVTILVLEKPPLQLDFPTSEEKKRVDNAEPTGLMDFNKCATECLEGERDKCWGFSLCGGVCYFGVSTNTKIVDDASCTLYRRHSNDSYMKSKQALISKMTEQVEDGKTISVAVKDKQVNMKAVSILVTNPAEDDPTFEKMGNKYSDRMRVLKVGKKLKSGKVLGKLRFEECQRLCLDYQDCETLSYCLIGSKCTVTTKDGDDLTDDADMETDQLCQIVTRKYADNFEVNPGFFLEVEARKTVKVKDAETCAKSCIKETGFKCLSFDLCGETDGLKCNLHAQHFLKKDTRKEDLKTKATCRHYTRKYSVEFKKLIETKVKFDSLAPLTNLDVEECAKTCIEYGQGACYAFDYCRGKDTKTSSCIIIDTDPSRLESTYSSVCTHFLRAEQEYAPRPYTNSYAGGIGFLCFLVGGIVGVLVVFGIAYIRVNKQ